ncbi:MAG: MgtC/SapB family protein [Ruminococcaceae bacterium]|nr:MgtC/SapB family protein [Oscillospiraceae bacterium]
MFIVDAWNWLLDAASSWSLLAITIRLLFALVVGLIIGIDRERKRRVAGIKTHILVCLGSALVMITSQYMMVEFGDMADISRMGAQVISGVGFLGVGTIIVTGRNQVKGLTTAASIWVCACVGLASGIGFIEGVVITLLLLVFTLKVLGKLDTIVRKGAKEVDLYIEFVDNKGLLSFCDKMKTDGHKIVKMQIGKCESENDFPNALFSIRTKDRDHIAKLAVELRRLKYVKSVEEL